MALVPRPVAALRLSVPPLIVVAPLTVLAPVIATEPVKRIIESDRANQKAGRRGHAVRRRAREERIVTIRHAGGAGIPVQRRTSQMPLFVPDQVCVAASADEKAQQWH